MTTPATGLSIRETRYDLVTEHPGQLASDLQLAMLRARYGWAVVHCRDANVLEVACGAGLGLEALARTARSVTAGDCDPVNLAFARSAHAGDLRTKLRQFDATDLPYEAHSFDVVLLFEALYYIPAASQFFSEAYRVLRPGGCLLLVSVNPDWSGFNPSPCSVRYHSAMELASEMSKAGFQAQLGAAFPESPGPRQACVRLVRKMAVRLHWIPSTMAGKRFLKRLFYGRLERVAPRLEDVAPPDSLRPVSEIPDLSLYRVLYAKGIKRG